MNSSRTVAFATTLLLASLTDTRTSADAISITPSADAFVSASRATNNYGGAGALAVSAGGLPQGEYQTVLRFDAAAVVAQFDATFGVGNWSVASVTLGLSATPPSNPIFNASAAGQIQIDWTQSDAWVEGSGTPNAPTSSGVTYATLPAFLGAGDEALGAFPFTGGISGLTLFDLTLTPGFRADLEAGQSVGLLVRAADANVSGLFNSRSFGTASARPTLTVTGALCCCPGDIDGDSHVNEVDLGILLANWQTAQGPGQAGDLDGSGFVDEADLGILLGSWQCVAP
ncbi:MAG: hypothetical protein U1D55_06965 [Phycisphaerae bacterium]